MIAQTTQKLSRIRPLSRADCRVWVPSTMFASEDMFADHDGPAKAAPPPPADEPEEWSASEDSDDALEESKGHTVTVTPPKRMAAGAEEEEDEWSDDDMEGSPQAVAPASETPRSSAAPPPTSGPAFVPTMGVGGYEWDGAQGVGVNPSRPVGDVLGAAPAAPAAAPQGQSAAAIRKAQLEQMKERERLKRLERIGGGGLKTLPLGLNEFACCHPLTDLCWTLQAWPWRAKNPSRP